MPKNNLRGIYFAFLAAGISGISVFVNKFAVGAVKSPLVFTSVKNTGVAVLIFSLLLATGKWRQIKNLPPRTLIFLILIGVIGGSLPFYLFFTGLSVIPAVTGAVIQKTLVFWVAVLALPFLREKLSVKGIAAVILLFAGNVLIGGFPGFKFSPGELYVLLATLLWAVETVLAKKILVSVDPDIVTSARMVLGSSILLFFARGSFSQISGLTLLQWAWIGLTAVLLLVYVTVWYRALKFASAVSVTAVLVVSTLITNALSAVFITHSFNSLLVLQTLIIILGLRLLLNAGAFSSQLLVLPRSKISG